MTPLLGSDLGRKETEQWCDDVLNLPPPASQQGATVEAFVNNLLRATYLLCSGYPRAVERLVKSYKMTEDWNWLGCIGKQTRRRGYSLQAASSDSSHYENEFNFT
eukprot:gene25253-30496_t